MKTRKSANCATPAACCPSRRDMLKLSGTALAGATVLPATGCKGGGPEATSDTTCLEHISRQEVPLDVFAPARIGKVP